MRKLTEGAMKRLGTRILMMLARGIVRLVDDNRGTQRLQLSLLADEVKSNVEKLEPYGFTSFPLIGAETLTAFIGGNRDHAVALMAHDRRYRPRNGQPGDVVLYHHSDDPEASAENARHRITLTLDKLVIRVAAIDIKCGPSRIQADAAGIRLSGPRIDLN